MKSEITTAITAVKQDVRLREWAEQLEAQQAIVPISVPQKSSDIRIEKNPMIIYENVKAAVTFRQAAEHHGLQVNRNSIVLTPDIQFLAVYYNAFFKLCQYVKSLFYDTSI